MERTVQINHASVGELLNRFGERVAVQIAHYEQVFVPYATVAVVRVIQLHDGYRFVLASVRAACVHRLEVVDRVDEPFAGCQFAETHHLLAVLHLHIRLGGFVADRFHFVGIIDKLHFLQRA